MARKDIFHDQVRKALENDGWIITDDPYKIKVGGIYQEIDLGAEKLIAAERGNEKIAVEIKSFLEKSHLTEFHEALGQFRNYRRALRKKEPDRKLFWPCRSLCSTDSSQNHLSRKPLWKKSCILLFTV